MRTFLETWYYPVHGTFTHLADAFIQSDVQCHAIQAIHFGQYVCFLGIELATFCAANAILYHWATGTHIHICFIFMYKKLSTLCEKKVYYKRKHVFFAKLKRAMSAYLKTRKTFFFFFYYCQCCPKYTLYTLKFPTDLKFPHLLCHSPTANLPHASMRIPLHRLKLSTSYTHTHTHNESLIENEGE